MIWLYLALILADRITNVLLPYGEFVVGVTILAIKHRRLRFYSPISSGMLVAAILFSGVGDASSIHSCVWCAKLLVIFLLAGTLRNIPQYGRMVHLALVASLISNGVLVLLGTAGIEWAFGEISAAGRRGTLLANPGGLSNVGIFVLFYFIYKIVYIRRNRYASSVCALLCLACIWRDGARTGFLSVVLLIAFFAIVLAMEGKIRYFVVTTIVIGCTLVLFTQVIALDESNPLARSMAMLDSYTKKGVSFAEIDGERAELMLHAMVLIADRPVAGNGLGAASLDYDTIGEFGERRSFVSVVHNAFLQVWADFGILGLTGFCGVSLGWCMWLRKWMYSIRKIQSAEERAFFYNAIAVLICFSFSLLFHPMSVELTDWLRLSGPYAILGGLMINATQKRRTPRFTGALRSV